MPHPPTIIFSKVMHRKCNWAQPRNGLEVQTGAQNKEVCPFTLSGGRHGQDMVPHSPIIMYSAV